MVSRLARLACPVRLKAPLASAPLPTVCDRGSSGGPLACSPARHSFSTNTASTKWLYASSGACIGPYARHESHGELNIGCQACGGKVEVGNWGDAADLGGEGVGQQVFGEAPDARAVIHKCSQELVEQVATPLHIILPREQQAMFKLKREHPQTGQGWQELSRMNSQPDVPAVCAADQHSSGDLGGSLLVSTLRVS